MITFRRFRNATFIADSELSRKEFGPHSSFIAFTYLQSESVSNLDDYGKNGSITAVHAENMAMGVEAQEIPKRLNRDDRSGHPIPLWNHLLGKNLQTFPSATTQF
jgi:hypothetical protein